MRAQLQALVAIATKHGWSPTHPLLLTQFIDAALTRAGGPSEALSATLDTRHLPEVPGRLESGPVQFGDDWPGVFLRGDNAAYYVMVLASSIESVPDPMARMALTGLQRLLGAALLNADGNLNAAFGPTPTANLTVVRDEPKEPT